MATNGSFSTSKYNNKKWLVFSWSVQSQSTTNNTTTIYWELKGDGTSSYSYHTSGNFLVKIGSSSSNAEDVYYSETRIDLYPRNPC